MAVDWSGARVGAERKIWLAEVRDRRLVRLECGRSREELTRHLVDEAGADPDLVVGLDFAFACPAWFARQHGAETVEDVWRATTDRGERPVTIIQAAAECGHRLDDMTSRIFRPRRR